MTATKDIQAVIDGLNNGMNVRVSTGYTTGRELDRVRVLSATPTTLTILLGRGPRAKQETITIESSMFFDIYRPL